MRIQHSHGVAHKMRSGAESGGGYKEEGEKLDNFLQLGLR